MMCQFTTLFGNSYIIKKVHKRNLLIVNNLTTFVKVLIITVLN